MRDRLEANKAKGRASSKDEAAFVDSAPLKLRTSLGQSSALNSTAFSSKHFQVAGWCRLGLSFEEHGGPLVSTFSLSRGVRVLTQSPRTDTAVMW